MNFIPSSHVLSFHIQSSHILSDSSNPVASWRELMNTFNIEFPSVCLRALMDGYRSVCLPAYLSVSYCIFTLLYSTAVHITSVLTFSSRIFHRHSACGVELQEGHFSGNFYWARCDHIAALPPLDSKYDAWYDAGSLTLSLPLSYPHYFTSYHILSY